MKFMIFEGTTKEFSEISPSMGLQAPSNVSIRPNSVEEKRGSQEDDENFSVNQVLSVLERRSLSEHMKEMLRVLYKAGDERVTSDDIKKALDFNAHEFRGMLGAFGNRVKNTPGVPPDTRLLDEHWDHSLGQKTWTLPASVRIAVEKLGLV